MVAAGQKTIAVVEAHVNLRRLYELELQDEGYNTIALSGHIELFPLLAGMDVHLIISDEERREEAERKKLIEFAFKHNIPLIIYTGYPSRCTSAQGGSSIAFVLKTADTVKLKNKIRRMLANEDSRQANSLYLQQEAAQA